MARTATTLTNTANANAVRIEACRMGKCHCGGHCRPELLNPQTNAAYLEAASQDFKAGDFVYLNAGAVTEILEATNAPIAGIALEDASTTTSDPVRIMPINSQDEYIMNVYSGTAGNTDTPSVGLLLGAAYDIVQLTTAEYDGSTSYNAAVMLDTQTDQRVVITGIYEDPTLTSSKQYIRVYVKFLPYAMVSGDPTYLGLQFP